MLHKRINQSSLHRPKPAMAIPVALSLALMAFLLMLCGCTVREESQPNANRRHVDVKVDVDVHRPRPVCPDGECHFRFGILDFRLPRRGILAGATYPKSKIKGPKCNCGCAADDCHCAGCCFRVSTNDANPKSKIQNPQCERPVMNLPENARCKNYNGGSCVCASTISLLRWQGRDDLAAALRNACSGGQSSASLHAKLERLGVRWASTTSGDVAFLEWAVRTRRGCGIAYYPMHFVNLVDLTTEHATLLDNNRVGQYISIPRDEFIRRWRGFGGWATAVVYAPAAPLASR